MQIACLAIIERVADRQLKPCLCRMQLDSETVLLRKQTVKRPFLRPSVRYRLGIELDAQYGLHGIAANALVLCDPLDQARDRCLVIACDAIHARG
ncbi:hypothetical protein A7A76_08205 [Lysobacter enzymogenes]|nr:hypothetical protein [Lysobacter enzymogenes]